MICATCKTCTPLCHLNSFHVANRPSITSSFTRRVQPRPKRQVVEVSTADSFGSYEPEDAYQRVCAETVKAIGEDLMKTTYQPESIDVIDIMQEVGQSLGFNVEYSRGRISVVAKAGIAHQEAELSLTRRLDDEQQHWKFLTGVNLLLPCESARRQPDISGWRKPVKIDVFASHTSQRPGWICKILSAETKKQDLPGGDKFNEYAASRIPHYWIVDPVNGRIFVYELVVDEYLQVQEVDFTRVVPKRPQHMEMPRPAHFQWDDHESTHMSKAVYWLNQHMCPTGVLALRAESCNWLKAAFGSIHLNLHKTDVVFLLEEARSEYQLNSLSENLMLIMLPFVVGLYELKTTKDLCSSCAEIRSRVYVMIHACIILDCTMLCIATAHDSHSDRNCDSVVNSSNKSCTATEAVVTQASTGSAWWRYNGIAGTFWSLLWPYKEKVSSMSK